MLIKCCAANSYSILQSTQQVTSIYITFSLEDTSSSLDQSISYPKKFLSFYPNYIFLHKYARTQKNTHNSFWHLSIPSNHKYLITFSVAAARF
jgi:hypothetical protein